MKGKKNNLVTLKLRISTHRRIYKKVKDRLTREEPLTPVLQIQP